MRRGGGVHGAELKVELLGHGFAAEAHGRADAQRRLAVLLTQTSVRGAPVMRLQALVRHRRRRGEGTEGRQVMQDPRRPMLAKTRQTVAGTGVIEHWLAGQIEQADV
ncbi:hypothetical protein D3C81_1619540 [compost metagenome]